MKNYCAVYITAKDIKEAEKIAEILLKERLVGCINIIPKIKSIFWWQGKLTKDNESLLIGKTRKNLQEKIIETVKKNHSYTVPCITFLPVESGNLDYFKWLDEITKK